MGKKIKVLHVMDKLSVRGSIIHGVTQAMVWWLPRFDHERFEFHVVSLRDPEPGGEMLKDVDIPVTFLSRSKFDPATILDLVNLIHRENVDIVHLHGYGSTNFGRVASKLTGIPNIVHEHSVFDNQPLYQTIADWVLAPVTDRAIAVSSPVYHFMINKRKIAAEKLETFFYGVPLADFKPGTPERIRATRMDLGISPDTPVITTVGRLDEQKGQIYLLQAAVKVVAEHPQARFLIVGDGPDMDMLRGFAEEARIADQVIFTGYRSDVANLLALSDIVVIPSLWEGGPITLFEAMQIEKPIICTPVGMMGDVIEDGENGYLVPVKSPEPIADRLLHLLKNPELGREMGRKAHHVCQGYDLQDAVDRLTRIYEEIAC